MLCKCSFGNVNNKLSSRSSNSLQLTDRAGRSHNQKSLKELSKYFSLTDAQAILTANHEENFVKNIKSKYKRGAPASTIQPTPVSQQLIKYSSPTNLEQCQNSALAQTRNILSGTEVSQQSTLQVFKSPYDNREFILLVKSLYNKVKQSKTQDVNLPWEEINKLILYLKNENVCPGNVLELIKTVITLSLKWPKSELSLIQHLIRLFKKRKYINEFLDPYTKIRPSIFVADARFPLDQVILGDLIKTIADSYKDSHFATKDLYQEAALSYFGLAKDTFGDLQLLYLLYADKTWIKTTSKINLKPLDNEPSTLVDNLKGITDNLVQMINLHETSFTGREIESSRKRYSTSLRVMLAFTTLSNKLNDLLTDNIAAKVIKDENKLFNDPDNIMIKMFFDSYYVHLLTFIDKILSAIPLPTLENYWVIKFWCRKFAGFYDTINSNIALLETEIMPIISDFNSSYEIIDPSGSTIDGVLFGYLKALKEKIVMLDYYKAIYYNKASKDRVNELWHSPAQSALQNATDQISFLMKIKELAFSKIKESLWQDLNFAKYFYLEDPFASVPEIQQVTSSQDEISIAKAMPEQLKNKILTVAYEKYWNNNVFIPFELTKRSSWNNFLVFIHPHLSTNRENGCFQAISQALTKLFCSEFLIRKFLFNDLPKHHLAETSSR